jgi:hypothetical protein
MPLLNINGVSCAVAHNDDRPGIMRRWTESGPEVEVRFLCEWGSGQQLAASLQGYITQNDDGSLSRVPPYSLPFAPLLYCTRIGEEEPFTPSVGSDGWMQYSGTIIPATFSALTWQIDDSASDGRVDPSGLAYTTTKFRVSYETYSPPAGAYYLGPFGTGAKRLSEGSIGIIRANVEINLVRHWITSIPLDETLNLAGCVNDEEITVANRTFPRGYLLFAGLETEPRNDANGYPVQELNYSILGRNDSEWNQILDDNAAFQYMNSSSAGTGSPPFKYVSFSYLFTS